MQTSGWIQLVLYVAALALITKPMGLYLVRVLDAHGKTWLDPVLRPLERLTYRIMGVRAEEEHDWRKYTWAMLLFSLRIMSAPRSTFLTARVPSEQRSRCKEPACVSH